MMSGSSTMVSSRVLHRRKTFTRIDKKIPQVWPEQAITALQYKIHIPSSMEELTQSREIAVVEEIPASDRHLVRLAPFPLAIGASRAAFYDADEVENTPESHRIVVCKELYIEHEDKLHRHLHEVFLQNHRDAIYLAALFDSHRPAHCPSILFTRISLLQLSQYCMTMEEVIRAPFECFSNHTGYVATNPSMPWQTDHRALQAFSHWTHQSTDGYLIIVGLQGGYDRSQNSFLLTSPLIHSKDMVSYGESNAGLSGMESFFRTHACNCYCEAMGLQMPSLPLG